MHVIYLLLGRGPRPRRGSAAIAVVALAGLLVAQAQGAPQPAPGFTLELLDGQSLSLGDLKGSPVILLFWAPW
jgi:cytochrome oxidase Cu insertion factor (SCO1/SenC/PrrC family)